MRYYFDDKFAMEMLDKAKGKFLKTQQMAMQLKERQFVFFDS